MAALSPKLEAVSRQTPPGLSEGRAALAALCRAGHQVRRQVEDHLGHEPGAPLWCGTVVMRGLSRPTPRTGA